MNAMPQRRRKQLGIALATLTTLALLVGSVFVLRSTGDEGDRILIRYADEASVQQNEAQGITALRVMQEYEFEEAGEAQFVVVVHNPNETWHASRVSYQFVIRGEGEKEEVLQGSSFVGSGSERLIIESFSEDDFIVQGVSFAVQSVDWVDARGRDMPSLRVRQTIFETTSSATSRVRGVAVNDSAQGAGDIEIGVLARNSEGVAVGADIIALGSLGAGENKEVEFLWAKALEGVVELSFFPVAESVNRPL